MSAETVGVNSGDSSPHHPLVVALDSWQAAVVLADRDGRTEFFRGLSFEDYGTWLLLVNDQIQYPETSGYIEPEQMNWQSMPGEDGLPIADRHVMYNSVGKGRDQLSLMTKSFELAKGMDDVDAAIAMLGIVQIAIHRLRNGHTRTMAAGRQLLSPGGQGYSATDNDRDFYSRLVTDRNIYLAQSLHPIRADLIRTYSQTVTQHKLANMGYDKSPDLLLYTGTVGELEESLPLGWSQASKRILSVLLSERHFALLTAVEYIDIMGLDIKDFIDYPNSPRPRLSIDKIIEHMRSRYDIDVHDDVLDAHNSHKLQFVRAIVDCIAAGDESVFGPSSRVLDHYRLP